MSKLLFIVLLMVTTVALVASARSRRGAVEQARWPSHIIPYAFSNTIDFDAVARARITAALALMQAELSVDGETCLRFVERHEHEKQLHKDYVLFVDSGNCSSGVGYTRGANEISLAKTCRSETSTIIHEVMHRLDLHFCFYSTWSNDLSYYRSNHVTLPNLACDV